MKNIVSLVLLVSLTNFSFLSCASSTDSVTSTGSEHSFWARKEEFLKKEHTVVSQ